MPPPTPSAHFIPTTASNADEAARLARMPDEEHLADRPTLIPADRWRPKRICR